MVVIVLTESPDPCLQVKRVSTTAAHTYTGRKTSQKEQTTITVERRWDGGSNPAGKMIKQRLVLGLLGERSEASGTHSALA